MASTFEGEGSPLEGIVEEDVPDHVFEQCNEALAEEVKKLQVWNKARKNVLLLIHLAFF